MINLVKAPKGYYTILDFMAMNELERRIALQEYRSLITDIPVTVMEDARGLVNLGQEVKRKARRKKSKYSRALSIELKKANFQARTKAGKLRKGMTPQKILKKAHKAAKRRLK